MKNTPPWFFGVFFLSGFCGLVYQIVWLRLAYAAFGINTQVMSVVLSVFMTGLGLGAWSAGLWVQKVRSPRSALYAYALAEGLIGLGAFLVPFEFTAGQHLLLRLGGSDSTAYLLGSALVLLASLLPWCFCMGTTFPLIMAFLQKDRSLSQKTFSFLYAANVIGAMAGVLTGSVLLIEWLGFKGTLSAAAFLNFTISLFTWAAASRWKLKPSLPAAARRAATKGKSEKQNPLLLLSLTGFISMALEVVWTRGFTEILRTQVYSFAALLFTYLLATALGSMIYRRDLHNGKPLTNDLLLRYAAILVLIPVVLSDPRIHRSPVILLLSLAPFCLVLGYLTPKLIDTYSQGAPEKAGRAYAVNILGCIAGPLAASYLLLPWMGSKTAMILLSLPFILLSLRQIHGWNQTGFWRALSLPFLALLLLAQAWFFTVSYEEKLKLYNPDCWTHQDYAATVIAAGKGANMVLFVNGINMTGLTPVTKFMAHLPLFFHPHPANSALDICFGMGTTFRALLSWGLDTTVVDLNRGVILSFPYFYPQSAQVLSNPRANIVVDDGRRFLERVPKTYDLITIDPPPPIEAAGSSLLYSCEFYQLAKSRLNPGGVLQQWYPGDASKDLQAVTRSLTLSFKYVRMYRSITSWGYHFIASDSPLEVPSAAQVLSAMPEAAKKDMMEWYPSAIPALRVIQVQLSREVPVQAFLGDNPQVMVRDNKPYNEYFLLRDTFPQLFP